MNKDLENMQKSKVKLIALSGASFSGKDSFFKLLNQRFPNKFVRFALADALKQEIDPFLKQFFGISAFTTDSAEKTIIRPLLVAWGRVHRTQSQGTYFTKILQPQIENCQNNGLIPVLCDLRYTTYAKDELYWIKEKNKGILVYINRIDKDGKLIPPPNEDEAFNNPILEKLADYRITWETVPNLKGLEKHLDFIENLI